MVDLGPVVTEDAKCEKEIRVRMVKTYNVSTSLSKIWKSHDASVKAKMRLLRTFVCGQ